MILIHTATVLHFAKWCTVVTGLFVHSHHRQQMLATRLRPRECHVPLGRHDALTVSFYIVNVRGLGSLLVATGISTNSVYILAEHLPCRTSLRNRIIDNGYNSTTIQDIYELKRPFVLVEAL